ncbi:MAG: hypothetical protein JWL77_2769 [Chthonomonadaceae bacterium]|nr:hypothetical protein [Chthonomonadaceae bacterium]
MTRKPLPLQSFRLKNFKAVRDSGIVKFTPLTVFIGNNGSGKSSLIEGLEMLQSIISNDLDQAMEPWRGFEHIWNHANPHQLRSAPDGRDHHTNPMRFEFSGYGPAGNFRAWSEVNVGSGGNEIFFSQESIGLGTRNSGPRIVRDSSGEVRLLNVPDENTTTDDILVLDRRDSFFHGPTIGSTEWQFLSLVPQMMSDPVPQKRTGGTIRLAKDGSNVAEYLLSIRKIDPAVVDGIVETLQYVLPYARDVQPALTSELERTVYLQMTEGNFKLPGWLLSTGTLRVLALLAVLRHPNPPSLLVIEEIENGLDPRTINLIVEEMRNAVQGGKTQIILTTHSPYLLDLLTLSQIVVVERDENGSPVFTRPGDDETLKEWTKKFAPGQLYTMGRLNRKQPE